MRPIGDIIWCGVSAPVIQGVFVGLGVSAVGLIVFPFAFIPTRPPAGIQSGYRRAKVYLKWSRRAAWVLGLFASVTLGGYVVLYTDASGRFCTERFDGHMLLGVYIWSATTGITFFLLVVVALLRGLTHRLSDKVLSYAAMPGYSPCMSANMQLTGWVAAEVLLSLPFIGMLPGLLLVPSLLRIGAMPSDVFLQAITYPFIGAVLGAVAGTGLSEIVSGSEIGVFLLAAAIFLPFFFGGMIAKDIRERRRDLVDLVESEAWQRDVEYLKRRYRITREDCLLFQRRAERFAARGEQLRDEARRSQFRAYWRGRSRRVRFTGYLWIPIGAYVAVRGVSLTGAWWCVVSLPTGGAWLARAWIMSKLERKAKESRGAGLMDGAADIRWHLGLLPHATSVMERLGIRAPCGITHAPPVA